MHVWHTHRQRLLGLNKSASQGLMDAQYDLGALLWDAHHIYSSPFTSGMNIITGIGSHNIKAYAWVALAIEQGFTKLSYNPGEEEDIILESLREKLSPDNLEAANQMIENLPPHQNLWVIGGSGNRPSV